MEAELQFKKTQLESAGSGNAVLLGFFSVVIIICIAYLAFGDLTSGERIFTGISCAVSFLFAWGLSMSIGDTSYELEKINKEIEEYKLKKIEEDKLK